ncbi:MAG TPA: efflux RND transporter periplasmic adaptor subunit [Chthoniobacteraceae bacterium]|jgi:Cu(I)/Ag(I) efflux system membrane fusion protein
MKLKTISTLLAIAAALAAGWLIGRSGTFAGSPDSGSARNVLFYQSPMHPWIKSDQPGDCTICGMKLVAVYEGQQAQAGGDSEEPTVRLSAQSISVLNVGTQPITRQPLQRTLRVAGTIDDDDSRHRQLSAYVNGRIDKLLVNFIGAEVTAGEPLAHLYSPELLTARDEYLLLSRQPASPQRDRMLGAARSRLVRMGLTPEQVTKLPQQTNPPDYLEILAPISGTVVTRKAYEGLYVKEGDVLFEIADFSKMWFVADVYERDLDWIRIGQKVEVTTPSLPGKVFEAPVDFIDPNLSSDTRSVKLRVILDNPLAEGGGHRRQLLHKVYARGLIHVEHPETLTVPRTAVLSAGGEPLAYVAKGEGAYDLRKLKLGRAGDDFYEVLSGIEEGELVVTTGNLLIDAQAQLNSGDHEPSAPESSGDLRALTQAEQKKVRDFLNAAAALGESLAADDLAGFQNRAQHVSDSADALAPAFPKEDAWAPLIARAKEVAHFHDTADLAKARKAFHPLAELSAELVKAARAGAVGLRDVKIYRCPMTADSFPGAPKQASWVQVSSPMKNPYFGPEMLDCGTEVKP